MKQELIYPKLSYQISGLLFETHNELGRNCSEKQYGDLLERKFKENDIHYKREQVIPVSFQGERHNRNRVDFLVEDKIILELKTKRVISREEFYQVKRYLTSFNKKLGLIVNFREKYLRPKRILNSQFVDWHLLAD